MDTRGNEQPKASRQATVVNPEGMHLRAASLLIQLARQFQCRVELSNHNGRADAKTTPLQFLVLGAQSGDRLTIEAVGPDAEEAVEAIAKLIEEGFQEPTEAE